MPEHKVGRDFDGDRIRLDAVGIRVYPFRADTDHELEPIRKNPRFLEQEIDAPFCCATLKEGGYPSLKLQSVFYWSDLNRERWADAGLAFGKTAANSRA
jgi:hypothetical protein